MPPRLGLLSIILILLTFHLSEALYNTTVSERVMFQITTGATKCLFQQVLLKQNMTLSFKFSDSIQQIPEIGIRISDLQGKTTFFEQDFFSQEGEISYAHSNSEKLQLCFRGVKIPSDAPEMLTIQIVLDDTDSEEYFHLADLDDWYDKLTGLWDQFVEVRNLQIYFEIREEQFRNTIKTIDFRLITSHIILALALFGTFYLQMYYLYYYISSKKLL
jgi:hypothetical protein